MESDKEVSSKLVLHKIGKGKKAVAVIGVRAYNLKYGGRAYELIHIPTDTLIADAYIYSTLAREIARSIIEVMGDKLLETNALTLVSQTPWQLVWYVEFYRGRNIKKPESYGEWQNGPEFESLQRERYLKELAINNEAKYKKQLSESDSTLGWVPDIAGPMEWRELEAIISGRPFTN